MSLTAQRIQLLSLLRSYESCAVAFSGGVDSAVVAKAAQLALQGNAVAVTGTSASLAQGELEAATALAQLIGIRHVVLPTHEFEQPAYLQNGPDRCYHCKTELYTQLTGLRETWGVRVVANGANLDDLGDYRPGLAAAHEHAVRSPLVECGLNKAAVRQLAAEWELPVWDKPAAPCLSSRVAYGEAVTPERLAMIDSAERFLRQSGYAVVRVRYHTGDLARVEVPAELISQFCAADFRAALVAHLHSLGFKFVTLDLLGFRSGSLNQLVQLGRESGPVAKPE